ncbi:MAG: lamin tail domain-containing protein [Chloroflexi bacterium]|nr:lamin tail domain-containing protein [Chloroflexota bacterium]
MLLLLILSLTLAACRTVEAGERSILSERAVEVIRRTPTSTPNIGATMTAEARERARLAGLTATVVAQQAAATAAGVETIAARRTAFWLGETATVQAGGTPRASFFRTPTPTATLAPAVPPTPLPTAARLPVQSSSPQTSLRIVLISFGGQLAVVMNDGPDPIDLAGWTLSNRQSRTYRFPTGFRLAPGSLVTIHANVGTNSQTDLFWGLDNRRAPGIVWDATHDIGVLRDAAGREVHRLSY